MNSYRLGSRWCRVCAGVDQPQSVGSWHNAVGAASLLHRILAYRALRITPDAKLHFLRLLEGRTVDASDLLLGVPSEPLDAAIRSVVEEMSHVRCAVTPDDFERLALEAASTHKGGPRGLHAKCVPGVNLHGALSLHHPVVTDAPADVSIALALERDMPVDLADDICRHVEAALSPRCLLTMRAHVVRAPHLRVLVACRIAPRPGTSLAAAIEAADAALQRRFQSALSDEPTAAKSRFGHPLHLATIAATIDRTHEVDHVEDITIRRIMVSGAIDGAESLVGIRIGLIARVGLDTRLGGLVSLGMRRFQTDHTGEAQTMLLRPWELVEVALARDAVRESGVGAADLRERPRG